MIQITKKTKKTNKSLNKQTNKQTNKHFLDPKYLSQIKSNLHKIFRGTFCWCPKKIKTKKQTNLQTNKQTNTQINILEPIYLSQIKSDLHEGHQPSAGARILAPVGGQTFSYIKKENKSINKQTNKQTNKHFKSYISQTNQVRSSRNFEGIFLWVSQDD